MRPDDAAAELVCLDLGRAAYEPTLRLQKRLLAEVLNIKLQQVRT
jgi:hypothetical protein